MFLCVPLRTMAKQTYAVFLTLFSAPSKVQNYQNKTGEKSLYQSKYVLTTCLKIFSNIYLYFTLYL